MSTMHLLYSLSLRAIRALYSSFRRLRSLATWDSTVFLILISCCWRRCSRSFNCFSIPSSWEKVVVPSGIAFASILIFWRFLLLYYLLTLLVSNSSISGQIPLACSSDSELFLWVVSRNHASFFMDGSNWSSKLLYYLLNCGWLDIWLIMI